MPELNDVTTGETIASQWGNDIRDRTIQRYADAAERDTEHPTPTQGDLSYLADTGDVDVYGPTGWTHVGAPVGSIQMVAVASPPTGWLLCQGQAVSRTTYAALFAELGTAYGSGDGSTTFNLPDMRQRFPLGKAASGTGSTLGGTGGAINHTHSGPLHTHTNPTTGQPSAEVLFFGGSAEAEAAAHRDHTHNQGNTGSAGTGNTGTANPPFIALNFAIKT